jgi:hypothetical protein
MKMTLKASILQELAMWLELPTMLHASALAKGQFATPSVTQPHHLTPV